MGETRAFAKARLFYEGLAERLVASGHTLDVFACSLDQVGLAEMRPAVSGTGPWSIPVVNIGFRLYISSANLTHTLQLMETAPTPQPPHFPVSQALDQPAITAHRYSWAHEKPSAISELVVRRFRWHYGVGGDLQPRYLPQIPGAHVCQRARRPPSDGLQRLCRGAGQNSHSSVNVIGRRALPYVSTYTERD